jgi:hypothetical protein
MSDVDGSSVIPPSTPEAPPIAPPEPPAAPTEPPVSPSEPPAAEEPVVGRESIVDAVADLLQMVVNYLRQETAGIMRDKVVLPGQQLGMLIAFAMAAAALLVIGLCFLFVAFLMVLAGFVGWPAALAIVGAAILIGAGVLTYLKMRSIQK